MNGKEVADQIYVMSYDEMGFLILSLSCLGVFAGFLAGLLGVGGGIILVPGLYFILSHFQLSFGYATEHLMHVCVATSLATIIPTGFSSSRGHYKKNAVHFDIVKIMGIGIVVGVTFAAGIAGQMSGAALQMVFAGAIMMLSLVMFLDPTRFRISDTLPNSAYSAVSGFVIGFLSSLIGIGGATLSVPYMTLHGMNIHHAIGTASALGLMISIPATIGFVMIGQGVEGLPPFSFGFVNLVAWVFIVPFSVLAAPFGVKVAHKISVGHLRKAFAIFMFLIALNLWRKLLFI